MGVTSTMMVLEGAIPIAPAKEKLL
jgi:hypothetical protein